jgi:hypothetical protein
MARKLPLWIWGIGVGIVALVILFRVGSGGGGSRCPGTLYYCPGVGCISGRDKCVAGAKGGPSVVFSQEPFEDWPGVGVASTPPTYGKFKEGFEMPTPIKKSCPGGTRTDGPCLMDV